MVKWIFGILAFLVVAVVATAVGVWMFPEAILTSKRVSGIVAPLVRFEPKDSADALPLVTMEIDKDGFSKRKLTITLRPGCYAPADPAEKTEICLESGIVSLSLRLDEKTYLKLSALHRLDFHVSRGELHPSRSAPEEPPAEESSTSLTDLFRYFDSKFAWGPLRLQVDRFEIPASKLVIVGKIASDDTDHTGTSRSPKLSLDVGATSPDWKATLDGSVLQTLDEVKIPAARFMYAMRGDSPIELKGKLTASYRFEKGDADVTLETEWKNPTPGIGLVRTVDARLTKRGETLSAKLPLTILLHGETPLGQPPLLPAKVEISMKSSPDVEHPPIDFRIIVDAYNFAGIEANSDLEGTLITGPTMGLKWKRGELKIEASSFDKTIRRLDRTSWAVPAPFNVFRGPVTLRTEPFKETDDRTTIPFLLTTGLRSQEQAFLTQTRAEVDIAKKALGLLAIRVKTHIEKIQIRLPDYDPLAPVPALARDSRIVRPAKKTKPATEPEVNRPAKVVTTTASPKPDEKKKAAEAKKSFPITIEIAGGPQSIIFLNRFFKPSFACGVNLRTVIGGPSDGAIQGAIRLGREFEIHYLNREIQLDRLEVLLNPEVEVAARVSMKRSGYNIFADLNQRFGKTQIQLGSEPPLQEGEIVSLLLYGMPRNSISTEQTKSVGSAQAAMGSEALGIFSFWAFASTPIESVMYDPETQTYAAIVKLPGGLVASIGSNWEDERQVALSKSLGRNWAVSTEIIRDAEGTDRGGTLLRWRKSY